MDDIQGVEIDELEERGRARRQVRRRDSCRPSGGTPFRVTVLHLQMVCGSS